MASDAASVSSLGRASWVLFEWGRNPYVLVITIYIYATYFSRDVVGDPVRGQALWAEIQGYAGLGVALLAPFLGAIADAGGRRKPWIFVLSIVLALSTATLWFGEPMGMGLGLRGHRHRRSRSATSPMTARSCFTARCCRRSFRARRSGRGRAWAWGSAMSPGSSC